MPTTIELETMSVVWEQVTDSELVRDYHDPVTLNTYRLTYDRRSTRSRITLEAQVTLLTTL